MAILAGAQSFEWLVSWAFGSVAEVALSHGFWEEDSVSSLGSPHKAVSVSSQYDSYLPSCKNNDLRDKTSFS